MKTTLTQAWEAKGLAGMVLREKVRWKLTQRFLDADPSLNGHIRTFVFSSASVAVIVILFYYLLRLMSGIVPLLDLSRTSDFLAVAFVFAGGIFAVIGAIYLVYVAWKSFASIGLVDRYIFQHRDDEVEL